jgi:exodeoxyribonuclease V gamma subunit
VGTTLPLDDVNGNCVELAGRFAVRRPRLLRVVEALQRPAALSDGIELLARVSDSNTWQSSQVQREVPDVLADADTRGDRLMRLPDVRAPLARQIAGSPARANFGTGTLTVCAMNGADAVGTAAGGVLGGLDDGAYPRLGVVDGDDAPARDPPIDAIGAATDKMVITYTGARSTLASRARPRCRWWNCSTRSTFRRAGEGSRSSRHQTSVATVRHSQRHPGRAGRAR